MLEVKNRILFLTKKCFSLDMFQDFSNYHRSWCYTNYGRMRQNGDRDQRNPENSSKSVHRGQSKQFEFSLMTYNCLSQDLIIQHQELYLDCPKGSLDWPLRKERLARELRESNPDIVCLQEVNSGHHNKFYKPFFKSLGYSGVYKKRTGSTLDGCAFYYRTSKFTLLDKIELEFQRRDLTSLLNRDNVAIIGVLKPSVTSSTGSNHFESSRLVVATTHLLFNPSRGEVKLAQLRLLFAELDQLINSFNPTERSKTNVILCGDMNLVPYSPLYNFITNGFLDTSGFFCGDLSGQIRVSGRGKLLKPCDLKMETINNSSQYLTDQREDGKSKTSEDTRRSMNSTNSSKSQVYNSKKYSADDFLKDPYNDTDERFGANSTQIAHHFKFSSVYPASDVNNLPFITTHLGNDFCMVDYIFYNRSDSLELLGFTRLFNIDQLARIGVLPNLVLGSDHLSLHAKFLIKG